MDVAVDDEGRIYVAQGSGGVVSRIDPDGTMTTVAGTGIRGAPRDGARATTSALKFPIGVAIDRRGELLVADQEDGRVSRVDRSGRVRFLAGVGSSLVGFDSFDARLSATTPNSVAVDGLGRIYIVGFDDRLRRIDVDGRITTLVGEGGVGGFNGDGVGTAVHLRDPTAVDVDLEGRILIADTRNHVVRFVDTDGTVTTVAGQGGVDGFAGDNGLATDALLNSPNGVLAIPGGGFFVADARNHRIRRVDVDGVITTVVGTGSSRFNGNEGDPLEIAIALPSGMAFDPEGRLVFADQGMNRVRRLDDDGILRTVAGNGDGPAGGEGRPATETRLTSVSGLARDPQGRLLLVDQELGRLHRLNPDGRIERLAGALGGGLDRGFGGDGGPARDAVFGRLKSVLSLPDGDIIVADSDNHRLRRIDGQTGIVTSVVGTGEAGFDDDGPAAGLRVASPDGLARRPDGGIVFGDRLNHLVRELRPDGRLVTLVGVRPPEQVPPGGAFNGDGLPALQTRLRLPNGFAFDPQSRLVIADTLNHRVRRVEFDGTVVTIAGNGTNASNGDGGLAVEAAVSEPSDLGFDGAGNLYITSFTGNAVRRVGTDGIITTVAGNGAPLPTLSNALAQPDGDGGLAIEAALGGPRGLRVEVDGVFFFCDGRFNVVRRVDAGGRIDTVAGIIHPPVTGVGLRSALPDARALSLADGRGFVAGGGLGRLFSLDVRGLTAVGVAAGYSALLNPAPSDRASLHPFQEVSGVAFDGDRLFVSDLGAGHVLEIDRVDPDQASTWTMTVLPLAVRAPAGLLRDGEDLLVADAGAHCVRRVDLRDLSMRTVAGRCDIEGFRDGPVDSALLARPTHLLVAGTSIYIADTGNHRVRRVRDGVVETVLGTGSGSSLGEGLPARALPVDSPGALAFDDDGNLFVASTTTIRQVANVDGDELADGDDLVRTILRSSDVPGGLTCVEAIARQGARFVAVDACRGRAYSVTSEVR
jgi:sugar lactone lactonase YvrE